MIDVFCTLPALHANMCIDMNLSINLSVSTNEEYNVCSSHVVGVVTSVM